MALIINGCNTSSYLKDWTGHQLLQKQHDRWAWQWHGDTTTAWLGLGKCCLFWNWNYHFRSLSCFASGNSLCVTLCTSCGIISELKITHPSTSGFIMDMNRQPPEWKSCVQPNCAPPTSSIYRLFNLYPISPQFLL